MPVKLGGYVRAGEPICTMFTDEKSHFAEAGRMPANVISIEDNPAETPPLIGEVVTGDNKIAKNHFPSPVVRTVG